MIGCWHKECSNCRKGVYLKENFFGDPIYKCSASGKKVKGNSGNDCGSWTCACEKTEITCKTCTYN